MPWQKIRNKKFILFILLVIASSAAGANAQSEQKALLKQRVDLYNKYFSAGNYEKMWEMSSKKLRGQNNDDKNSYIKNLIGFRSIKLKTRIKNLKIEKARAVVNIKISLWAKEKQKWLRSTENNVWVFEDNDWFFDSQIEK